MKKALILIGILFVIVGLPVGKKFLSGDDVKQVETQVVAEHSIKASILASGQLKHEEEVKLTAEVISKVSQLYVKEGDQVTKGQLVLTLDDQAFVAAVEQQQAVVDQQVVAIEKQKLIVENLQTQFKRKQSLYNKNLLDQDAFDLSQHQLQVAQVDLKAQQKILNQVTAALEQAKDRLSKTQIVSPINGIVTSLDIKVGETAISSSTNIAGSSLMTIANPNSMLAEIQVDEADIAQVKVNQKAEIIAIALADLPIEGRVESIASSAKRAPGRQNYSFAVKLKLNANELKNLRPGMSCRAEVFTRGEQALLSVPVKAIVINEDRDNALIESYVFVAENGTAKKVKVKTGIADDDYQEIVDGLSENQQIIVGPDKILRHLKEGDLIEAIGVPFANAETASL